MISKTTLNTLVIKYQTTELNIWREYFKHIWLSHFYRQSYSSNILFKGGTALRIIHKSPRFSEDLDFSINSKSNSQIIEETLLSTLESIQKENISVSLTEAKTTTGGYLANILFHTQNKPISIHLEISYRNFNTNLPELITIAGDFIPPYTLTALSQNQLISEKIQALLFRQKPRDFYDLYFILRANLLPSSQKRFLNNVPHILSESGLNLERELKLFLPKSSWPIIKDLKSALQREI